MASSSSRSETESSWRDSSQRPINIPPSSVPFQHTVSSPVTGYFSTSHETGTSGTSRGIPVYKPRSSRSYMSLNLNDRGRGRKFGPSSWQRSSSTGKSLTSNGTRSGKDVQAFDNWQGLHDIITSEEEEEEDDDTATILGTPRMARATSIRSLRSFFSQAPSSAQSTRVLRTASSRDREGRSIDAFLSTSPPPMESYLSAPEAPGIILEQAEAESEDERGDVMNGQGAETPLLGHKGGHETTSPASKPSPGKDGIRTTSFWPPSPVFIAILKCAITYLLASLFTFVPRLAQLLSTTSETDAHGRVTPRPAYSAHMVATIVVYFNPAKTVGNMLLATRFCVVLAALATAVSLLSMLTLAFFDHLSPSQGDKWDWISEIGDWMVCGVLIGGSMGLLAWLKVWVNNPSFNSGCSMAAVTIYTVVIKEGAIPKLLEVLLIVAIGAVITNLTCYLVFPSSATNRLETSISRSLQSFSTLLDLLTSTFLLKRNVAKGTPLSLKDAIKSHAAAFNKLKTDLAEAKNERLVDSRIRGHNLELYDALIGSLTRLAQHLAGLRGGTRLQEGLIKASRDGRIQLDIIQNQDSKNDFSISVLENPASPGPGLAQDIDVMESVNLFHKFRDLAGHEMDSLVDYCEEALESIQTVSKRENQTSAGISEIRNQLASSLRKFSISSSQAIKRLYAGPRRRTGIYGDDGESESGGEDTDESTPRGEDPSGGPNETVFLIYFFLFTLEEFARELLFLLDTFSQILDAEKVPTLQYIKSLWPNRRGRKERRVEYLYKQFRSVVPVDPSQLQPALFPKVPRNGRSSLVSDSPTGLAIWNKAKQRFWEFGDWLRTPDIRYAIKTGLGGAILAAPAFTEMGRPIFLEYRGEWALIAYFSAISPTVGQTNFLSFFRIIGTLAGASVAVLFYNLFPENPIVLPILGVMFSLPCFYVITQMPNYSQAGRFTLLTYNLTCLYAYNSREHDISAFSIAFHRSTSVIIGVIWAALVSRFWWPFTARRELRMGLSDFCLDLSYLYSKLVTTYSRGIDPPDPSAQPNAGFGEQEPLLPVNSTRQHHLNAGVRQFLAMELHLQSQLGSLRNLLSQTKNEPRLKGPFAFDFYKEVLLSCERMLDRLHSMRCVTTRDEWDNGIREAFVVPVNKQRREMAGNVILYFYTISAGFRLRTPMPPYLPPAEEARQRLVEAIRDLDVVKRRSVRGGGRHLLFFAYALAMQEVIAELEYLGELMQEAFGVISQSTVVDFESLFHGPPVPGTGLGLGLDTTLS